MSKNQLSAEQPPLQINTLTSEVTEHQGMKIINRPEGVIMAWESEPDFDVNAMATANGFNDVMLETTQDMMTGETRSVASVKMSHEEYEEFRNQPHVRTMELPAMVPEATSNTLGQLTFMPSASNVRAEYANPPEPAPEDIEKPEAPPGERSSEKLTALKAQREANKSQFIDPDAADEYVRFDDLNQSVDELIGQIKGEPGTLTDYAAQATRGVLGFASDVFLGVGELVYEGGKLAVDAAQTMTPSGLQGQVLDAQILMEEIRLGNITSDTALSDAGTMASAIGQSIVAPVTEPWNNGQYIEAITRGGAEIASLPLAVLKGNKLSKAAKAADAASDASSASRAVGTAQDAGNAVKSYPATGAADTARSTKASSPPSPKGPSGNGGKISPKVKKPSYIHGKSDGGPGVWKKEATPTKGAEYQQKVTGAPKDTEYVVDTDRMASGKKKFDGYDPNTNTLIDAKDWDTGTKGWPPEGQEWASRKVADIAKKDSSIAKEVGSRLEYHVPTTDKANQLSKIFMKERIKGVALVVTPKDKP